MHNFTLLMDALMHNFTLFMDTLNTDAQFYFIHGCTNANFTLFMAAPMHSLGYKFNSSADAVWTKSGPTNLQLMIIITTMLMLNQ